MARAIRKPRDLVEGLHQSLLDMHAECQRLGVRYCVVMKSLVDGWLACPHAPGDEDLMPKRAPTPPPAPSPAPPLPMDASAGARMGGNARAAKLSPEERARIGREAALRRWARVRAEQEAAKAPDAC